MISRIHSKIGTAGLVVAIVALVVALTGVAVAATGLNGKQKKEVKSIAKQFAGKNGAPGAQGPKGDSGAAGSAGKNGADGAPGANGKSVVLTAEPAGVNCKNAGTKVEVEGNAASKKYVCNGQTGFTETLPSGKTETGTWAVGTGNSGATIVPLSFNIPLAAAPESLHFISEDGKEHTEEVVADPPVNCKGSAEEPSAPAGQVCVYETLNIGAFGYLSNEALTNLLPSGATFFYLVQAEQAAFGTWAVTAK